MMRKIDDSVLARCPPLPATPCRHPLAPGFFDDFALLHAFGEQKKGDI
ncbi:MAG TPA: hypothetical protein VNX28_07195 [Gemmataceae bacterium]|jgi:hypothetical protein|nr:hypothetical protein [Gemmataceae bacterium]